MKNNILNSCLLLLLCSISYGQSPGNISSNLQWWFKANAGTSTTTDAAEIASWTNYGNFATTSVTRTNLSSSGYPMYKSSILNFNPIIRFSSAAFFTETFDLTNMNPTADNSTAVIVFQSTQNSGNTLQYQSPNLISTERTVTVYDYELGFTGGKVALKINNASDTWTAKNTSTYYDGYARIATATRLKDATAANPSTLDIYVNAKSDITTTSAGNSYTLNSPNSSTSANYGGFMIGAQVNADQSLLKTSTAFSGDIAEIIVYDAVLTAADLKKVQSYLAVKYGITLDQTSAYDYQKSDGTIIWDGTSSASYNKDIAGIGQDDNSGLNQTKSQSINAGAMVLMKTPSAMANNEFMMWGDNGLAVVANTELTDVPTGIETRLKRIWKTTETGDIGTVTVTVDLATVAGNKTLGDLRLIVDDDATFATGTTTLYSASSLTSNIATFNAVDFSNASQRYFTIGSTNKLQTPLPITFLQTHYNIGLQQIIWTTADELNITKFLIESSSDTKNWLPRGVVAAKNTLNNSTYTFDISSLETTDTYFKIVAIDNQLQASESETIVIKKENKKTEFTIFPDPCRDYLNISANSDFEILHITNAIGQLITNYTLDKRPKGYIITTNQMKSGLYFLNIKNENNNMKTIRFEVIE
jgi:hypothetical protein